MRSPKRWRKQRTIVEKATAHGADACHDASAPRRTRPCRARPWPARQPQPQRPRNLSNAAGLAVGPTAAGSLCRPAGNAQAQSRRRPGHRPDRSADHRAVPPGISLIASGWPINSACLDALEQARAAGGRVVASDPSLEPSPLSRAPALANRPDRRSFRSGSPSATPACQGRPRPPARAGSPGNSVSASRHRRCQPGD